MVAAVVSLLAAAPAAAQETAALVGACFVHEPAGRPAGPTQRVASMAVLFQSFGGDLLASVGYRLRYGTAFGISGDCGTASPGGYECRACANGDCGGEGETFRVLWRGGETLTLVNDRTGMLATNPAGGRDYLWAGGTTRVFVLRRGSPDDCTW